MSSELGGYENGYQSCDCFWGDREGSLISKLNDLINIDTSFSVLDLGCGEGKNSIYFARRGATVCAIDISKKAILNAKNYWPDSELVNWNVGDVLKYELNDSSYDIVIMYGLLHCFSCREEILRFSQRVQSSLKSRGYIVLCAFNNRHQELCGAHPGFNPTLICHDDYISLFETWNMSFESDQDLTEIHPHNCIEHTHSMTRIIAQKP